jgi:hypothetical protein
MNLDVKFSMLQAKAFFIHAVLESIAYDDNDFRSANHDGHLSDSYDLIAFGLQEFDNYEDPHAYSHIIIIIIIML